MRRLSNLSNLPCILGRDNRSILAFSVECLSSLRNGGSPRDWDWKEAFKSASFLESGSRQFKLNFLKVRGRAQLDNLRSLGLAIDQQVLSDELSELSKSVYSKLATPHHSDLLQTLLPHDYPAGRILRSLYGQPEGSAPSAPLDNAVQLRYTVGQVLSTSVVGAGLATERQLEQAAHRMILDLPSSSTPRSAAAKATAPHLDGLSLVQGYMTPSMTGNNSRGTGDVASSNDSNTRLRTAEANGDSPASTAIGSSSAKEGQGSPSLSPSPPPSPTLSASPSQGQASVQRVLDELSQTRAYAVVSAQLEIHGRLLAVTAEPSAGGDGVDLAAEGEGSGPAILRNMRSISLLDLVAVRGPLTVAPADEGALGTLGTKGDPLNLAAQLDPLGRSVRFPPARPWQLFWVAARPLHRRVMEDRTHSLRPLVAQ